MPPKKREAVIGELIAYIEDNLSAKLTLEALADRFGMSRSSLIQKFRAEMGTSLYAFIIRKRLDRSQELMRSGATAAEAGREAGFGDYSVFYRAFRLQYGISPREYQKAECMKRNMVTRPDL